MITYADILDSAVKIGLGAAISGLSTYLVTKVKSDSDQRAEIAKHKRDLLERIALASQESATAISKAMLIVQRLGKIPQEQHSKSLVKVEAIYQTVVDEHNTAEGLAALFGSPGLSEALTRYGDLALNLFQLVRLDPLAAKSHDDAIGQINMSRIEVNEALRSAYKQCNQNK